MTDENPTRETITDKDFSGETTTNESMISDLNNLGD